MILAENTTNETVLTNQRIGAASIGKKKVGLILGFGAVLFLMVLLAVIGLLGMDSIESRLEQIVHERIEKIKLVSEMHTRARERTLNLHRMLLLSDPFMRDDEHMAYIGHGTKFAVARTAFLTLKLTEDEVRLINEQSRFTSIAVPIQDEVVNLVANGRLERARVLLVEGVIPIQDRVLEQLADLKEYQIEAATSAGREASTEYTKARNWVLVLSVLIGVIGISIAYIVVSNFNRSTREREKYLSDLEDAKLALEESSNNLMAAKAQVELASNAKSQFLANMSHELRTPLNAIIGYSELLRDEINGKGLEGLGDECQKIQGAAKYLSRIISEILDLSKIESGKIEFRFEYFDLKTLVDEVSVVIAPLANKNGNMYSVNLDPDLGLVYSDAIKIRQILFNILNNACRFTKNGKVTLSANIITIDGKEWCLTEIEDTGIGISDDVVEHIFQPFVQVDGSSTREFGGTGLGLAIASHLCVMIDGEIKVESELGKGTVFKVFFPIDVTGAVSRRNNNYNNYNKNDDNVVKIK